MRLRTIIGVSALVLMIGDCAAGRPAPGAPGGDESGLRGGEVDSSGIGGLAGLSVGVEELSRQIHETMVEQGIDKVAVLPLSTVTGSHTALGVIIADKLSHRLARYGERFEVVDRIHLSSVVRETELELTGPIDPETAQELGRLLGVDALVAGTTTDLRTEIEVVVRILGTDTRGVLGAASVILPQDGQIAWLLSREVEHPLAGPKRGPFWEEPGRARASGEGPVRTVPGLRGYYYDGFNWGAETWPERAVFTRIDRSIDYRWGESSPARVLSDDSFGIVWEGEVGATGTGVHTFVVLHDGAARLLVDGRLLVDEWQEVARASRGRIPLEGGKWYPLKLEFLESSGAAHIVLKWTPPNETDAVVIPTTCLRSPIR